jgi:tRNA U34 5-carboxymethylaminomethyl modifying enzyme MnmG/GidA
MSQVNPIKYDSNLGSDVIMVTKGEMERLMDGRYNLERVNTDRISNFIKDKDSVTNQSKLISGGWGEDAHRVNFMIKDVEEVDGKIKISVKILKAGKMVDRKMIPDSNFKDNPELVDNIMKTIKQDILRTYPKYLTNSNTEIELID